MLQSSWEPAIEPAIVAALIGAVVALFGYIAVHRLSFWRERHARLTNAATFFRAAVDPAVFCGLSGHPLHGALIQVFPKHLAAAREFRRYLGPLSYWQFIRAWKAYHGGSEENPDWFVRYCLPKNGPELLVQRLEALRNAASQT